MTNYQDGELLSMVSTPDKEDVEWQAISYALKWAMGELVKHSYYIRTYCAIYELPEKILDAMAVALRTQYYDDSLDIAIKRKLVKNSLQWYSKAGTASAVKELVETVFGYGEVVEWYDTEGMEPFTFGIESSTTITKENYERFVSLIESVKRRSAHLKYLASVGDIESIWYLATGDVQTSSQTLTNDITIGPQDASEIKAFYIPICEFPEVIDRVTVKDPEREPIEIETNEAALTGIVQEAVLSFDYYMYGEAYTQIGVALGITQDSQMEIH